MYSLAEIIKMNNNDKDKYKYTVWVGGGEVNDFYLTIDEAEAVAEYWIEQGYDDVVIEEI